MMMTGTFCRRGVARMACSTSKPSTFGILMSTRASTGCSRSSSVSASPPSLAMIRSGFRPRSSKANVDVYCNMLREFVKDSQFIVITHKKRTMQRVDAIYGITQNEPGVSTKISVKCEEIHKLGDTENAEGELAPTVRGAGPFAG